jgi:penicillin-binding protein 2
VRDVLLGAMKSVTENGSAARVFRNYPIEMGGKTGTAQVLETKSDNAIFTAFAPFNNPEIVVTCVIEQGANGTDAGFAVRDVFDYYFDVDSD